LSRDPENIKYFRMNSIRKICSIITFSCWTRKNYAVFNSLRKVIRIGTLSVTYSLLILTVKAQGGKETDTLRIPDQEIEEVVVSAGRTPVGAQQVARLVTVISKNEIERSPALNINDLLRYISSVDIRQRGPLGAQADISIRGGTYDQTLILLNGINISDPQTGHHNLNLPVDLESIQRIEILQGPAAKSFGPNAFNGVINIITGNNGLNHIRASVMAGQFGLYKGSVNISQHSGHFSHFLSAGHTSSGGYIHNTDFSNSNLFYQAGYLTKSGMIDFQAGTLTRDFGANSFYSLKYPDQFEAVKTTFFSLKYQSNSRIRFSPAVYLRRNRDRFELIRNNESKVPFNHHLSTTAGINLNLWKSYRFGKTSLGLDFRNEHILSNVLGNPLEVPVKVRSYDSVFYSKSTNRLNSGLYAEHSFSRKKITVQAGLMAHHNSGLAKFRVYPGLDIRYNLKNYLSLFGAINKTLRMPTFTDMFYKSPVQKGNPQLKPEEALTLEGGIKYNSPVMKAHLTSFFRKGYNLIDWVKDPSPDSLIWRSMNHTQINLGGAEISFKITPPSNSRSDRIQSAEISYAFLQAGSDHGNFLSKYALDYLRHQIISSFDFRIGGKWYTSLRMTWRDRNGTYQDGKGLVVSYKPYWISDVRMYRKADQLTLFANLSNIFNSRYFDYGGIRQPGVWFMAGMTVDVNYLKRQK
jgi:vitamin B12 transporter